MRGQSLELFFIDGTPDGMLTAEIFNWTGHVLLAPRIRLAEALKRKEASYTGVYILLGYTDESNLVQAYIGEAEDIADRIRNHDATREWWTQAIFITSAANSLNKAHVKYLESRLVEIAKLAGRMKLMNLNTPPRPSLSESSISNMEQFIDYILTILPAIRVDGLNAKTRSHSENDASMIAKTSSSPQRFSFKLANGEVDATASLENGEFVVQRGSKGRADWIGVEHNYQRLFDELVESGIYAKDGLSSRRFTKAFAFSSPSAAGAVLSGRSTAGPIVWVVESDPETTYKTWEQEQLRTS